MNDTILTRIARDTRELVAHRKKHAPIAYLEDQPYFQSPTLSLKQALSSPTISVIAEIKQASPSKGVIRPDLQATEIARQYKLNGAAAISVLTEPLYFKGSLERLRRVRQYVDLPLLRKDFILDSYQLYEARAYGADAVLLIATMLEADELAELYETATMLGLECLVEVYHEEDLEKVDVQQVAILGVNNRDLHTFKVDVSRGVALLERLPESLIKVSESGLASADELALLEARGIHGALIGETLMKAVEPGRKLRELLEGVAHLKKQNTPLRLVG